MIVGMGSDHSETQDLTRWLHEWRDGSPSARDKLCSALYPQLRKMAGYYMNAEQHGVTMQPTALVHEAYLRIADADLDCNNRAHFLALMGQVMRRMLVDQARTRSRLKRGSGQTHLSLDEALTFCSEDNTPLLELDDVLTELGGRDKRKEQILEMHYFGGLTHSEIAETVGISAATVDRDLRFAKAWIKRALSA